jgi:hypothetical protein
VSHPSHGSVISQLLGTTQPWLGWVTPRPLLSLSFKKEKKIDLRAG